MSGVAEVRATIAEAQDRLALIQKQTVLFLDEIHRFNKTQQDALLPHVEGRARGIGLRDCPGVTAGIGRP